METSPKSPHSEPVTKTPTTATGSSQFVPSDLSNVKLLPEIFRNVQTEIKHFNGSGIFTDEMFARTLGIYSHFDILTYSITPMAIFHTRPIHRLIYHTGQVPRNTKKSIRLSGTHAKLWICHQDSARKAVHVYLGSANATSMTLHELIVRLTDSQALIARKHFDKLWENNL